MGEPIHLKEYEPKYEIDFAIRVAQQSDVIELRDLYKNTVLEINRRDYSQEEVEDWASCGDDLAKIKG